MFYLPKIKQFKRFLLKKLSKLLEKIDYQFQGF